MTTPAPIADAPLAACHDTPAALLDRLIDTPTGAALLTLTGAIAQLRRLSRLPDAADAPAAATDQLADLIRTCTVDWLAVCISRPDRILVADQVLRLASIEAGDSARRGGRDA